MGHIGLLSTYFLPIWFFLCWYGATHYPQPRIGGRLISCHVYICIKLERYPPTPALLRESYASVEWNYVLCPYHLTHLNIHLMQRPCRRDPFANSQSMYRMVNSEWLNALHGCMHVVHKEFSHPTTWDDFKSSLRVSVSLCCWQLLFFRRSMDEMFCFSSTWVPSFSTSLSKTIQGNESLNQAK